MWAGDKWPFGQTKTEKPDMTLLVHYTLWSEAKLGGQQSKSICMLTQQG